MRWGYILVTNVGKSNCEPFLDHIFKNRVPFTTLHFGFLNMLCVNRDKFTFYRNQYKWTNVVHTSFCLASLILHIFWYSSIFEYCELNCWLISEMDREAHSMLQSIGSQSGTRLSYWTEMRINIPLYVAYSFVDWCWHWIIFQFLSIK